MGNNQPKLQRKFSSLPPQEFPSSPNRNSNKLKRSVRAAQRNRHDLSFDALKDQREKEEKEQHNGSDRHQLSFVSALFLPEYSEEPEFIPCHFEVLDVIANGAFGNVLKVSRRENGVVYAMKVMTKSKIIVEGAVKQCKDEACIQDAVGHHPFIVKPYFFVQDPESIVIIMDYIPKGELFAAWKQTSHMSEALVRLYIAELALVLGFLHDNGVIYRDLKMENILIDAQGHLQVIDFGLAKWLQRGGRTQTVCGTLQYIAPEVLQMLPYGHAADWWSLGILMYALLVGAYPVYGARDHYEMAARTAAHVYELPFNQNFSWEARQCIKKLLYRNSSTRLQELSDLQKEPFFRDINFSSLLQRKITPDEYVAHAQSQEAVFGLTNGVSRHPGSPARRPCSPPTHRHSYCGDLREDTTLQLGNLTYQWNESVASLEGHYV